MKTTALLLLAALAAAPAAAQPTRTPGATPIRGGSVINVEVDYMVETGAGAHSHRPTRAEMDAVEQMFACQGITLNVVIDDEIAHRDVLIRDPDDEGNFFDYEYERHPDMSFLGIKNQHFDRGDGWHYAVFGHQYQNEDYETTGSSGLGERPGDDFIVTLGNFDGEVGTSWDRASTFAHELGHNLGLRHNGSGAAVGDHNPNLPSIMSYFYQLQGVRTAMMCQGLAGSSAQETLYKELDYSHGRACSLTEAALDEGRGMGIVPVDWNCDGAVSGTVEQNVNGNGSGHGWCGSTGLLQTLSDYDEWSNIEDVTSLAKGTYESEDVSCVTAEEIAAYRAQLASLAGGGVTCPQPTLTQEACPAREMRYVVAGGSGIPAGTCRLPFHSLEEAHTLAGDGDVLHLAPGSYPAAGTVLTKPLQLLGPGGAVLGD